MVRDHKIKDIDFDKSFIEGMVNMTMGTEDKTSIQRRYVKALERNY